MTGPDPAVARQRVAVRAELADLADRVPGALVLVACSGGADSLALAAATAFEAPRAGLRAGAVVVDHSLQAGSGGVARTAADRCRALGLAPVVVRRVVVAPSAAGPEAAAREARYAALEEEARDRGAAAVLLGHTLDDQAETVLLRLARGSGARSLAGMPPRRGVLRRPFLDIRRSETEEACRALDLNPWHDPTNGPGAAPLRSRVRHEVLPVLERVLGPGVAVALARTADQLAADDVVLARLAEDLLERAAPAPPPSPGDAPAGAAPRPPAAGDAPPGEISLDVAVLAGAAEAVRRRALRAALVRAGVPDGALQRVHVLAVDALLTDWHGQGPVALPGGRAVRRRCGRLTVGHDEQGRRASGGRG
nr:tRNA lysidine(34) synthetase TilS [uncultured Actinotalea sp.]